MNPGLEPRPVAEIFAFTRERYRSFLRYSHAFFRSYRPRSCIGPDGSRARYLTKPADRRRGSPPPTPSVDDMRPQFVAQYLAGGTARQLLEHDDDAGDLVVGEVLAYVLLQVFLRRGCVGF